MQNDVNCRLPFLFLFNGCCTASLCVASSHRLPGPFAIGPPHRSGIDSQLNSHVVVQIGFRAVSAHLDRKCDGWKDGGDWECEEGCDDQTEGVLKGLYSVTGSCGGGLDPAQLWTKLDKPSLLAMAAVDRIINHADSWCGRAHSGKNYLLAYGHVTEKFQLIPWSTDTAWQSWTGWGTPGGNGKEWYKCGLMEGCLKNQGCEDDYDTAYSQVVRTIRESRQEILDYIELASSQEPQKKGDAVMTQVIENL